jgi:predicted AAA+ superfamily ATPase
VLAFIRDYSIGEGAGDLQQVERAIQTIARNNGGHATVKELMNETYTPKNQITDYISTLEEMGRIETVNSISQAMGSDDKVKPSKQ